MQKYVKLMEQFYTHFQQRDYAGMTACYHPQITFSDPVFTALKGKQVGAMWHMLIERGTDMTVTFREAHLHDDIGHIHWEAHYTFSSSKRPVHNIIDAEFKFADDKIINHRDQFDFWRWSRQALGTSGVLLGWSPVVQTRVRETAMKGLNTFIAQHPEYQ